MINLILIAIVLMIIGFVIKVNIYEKKISKAFCEKSWDVLPDLILKKYVLFGNIVAPKKYYQYYLKYLVESGFLLSRDYDSVLKICGQLLAGNEDDYIFLVLRNLYLNEEVNTLIVKMKESEPLRDALLSYARKDYEGFISNIFSKTSSNMNVRTLIALLALKANQKVTIDIEMQKSPYYNSLKEYQE